MFDAQNLTGNNQFHTVSMTRPLSWQFGPTCKPRLEERSLVGMFHVSEHVFRTKAHMCVSLYSPLSFVSFNPIRRRSLGEKRTFGHEELTIVKLEAWSRVTEIAEYNAVADYQKRVGHL